MTPVRRALDEVSADAVSAADVAASDDVAADGVASDGATGDGVTDDPVADDRMTDDRVTDDRATADGVTAVADSMSDLLRTVRRSRARLLAAAGDDVESATQVLLRTLAAEGPIRTSALAASVGSDLSTVSRQVALLVSRGLIERRADQFDGRASLLVLTDAGRIVIAEHGLSRQAFFDEVLAGWTAEDLHHFARSLERFTASYDRTHAAWLRDGAGPSRTVADRTPACPAGTPPAGSPPAGSKEEPAL